MAYSKLNFGTAGIPISCEGDILDGIRKVKELGLSAMELEFVRSVNVKEDKATQIRNVAKREGVELTCHGQYYINLNSLEKAKIHASIQRVTKAATIADMSGAQSVTFHPAFYMKIDPKTVFNTVKKSMIEIRNRLDKKSINITLSPETTGKLSQFGTVDELIKLAQEIEGVRLCVDFSHVYARSAGNINSYEKFSEILEKIENGLGRDQLNNMHIHTSGIVFGDTGEKNHVNLKECPLKYKELVKAWKDFKIKGVVICESPNIEEDALLMKNEYDALS